MSTPAPVPRYKLTFTVPHHAVEVCKSAVFSAGAGTSPDGKYSQVCFETAGTEQFMPDAGAQPNIGAVGKVQRVEVTKVEVLCVGRDIMVAAVNKMKRAHPYEEVAYEVFAMEDV
ncbi:MAG: hypothetical protein LQ342_004013 [Letrouitia transgressa]|nr:MAG: hypothetical protein LQ342_004013 [Letrouitia transgressa]